MAQTLSERVSYLEKHIEELEKTVTVSLRANEIAMTNLHKGLNNLVNTQREEIVKLRKELDAERQDRRNRRAKAIAQLKSE